MLQEALSRIRDAEDQAATIRAQATAEAKSIRESIRSEIQEMEISIRTEIATDRERLFSSARKRGKTSAEKIRSEMNADIEQLKQIAERHMNDAVLAIQKRLTA